MNDNLKHRLAITTGAAAAAFGPAAANAAVVFVSPSTAPSVGFTTGDSANWDVDGDGTNDFSLDGSAGFSQYGTGGLYSGYANATVNLNSFKAGYGGRGFVRKVGDANWDVRDLGSGFAVGATLANGYDFGLQGGRNLVSGGTSWASETSPLSFAAAFDNISASVKILGGGTGDNLVGFRFEISGATHYGWANLFIDDGTGGGRAGDVTITQWAYESTADCAINVGQTSGDNCSTPSVPNPGTLALLAAGAAGLRRWRGKAKAA